MKGMTTPAVPLMKPIRGQPAPGMSGIYMPQRPINLMLGERREELPTKKLAWRDPWGFNDPGMKLESLPLVNFVGD